ncbi:MAG TPA: hypothetical protein VF945_17535 [Polyangia bacterium]
MCATGSCISDGNACTAGGAPCCSQSCTNGTCAQLGTGCHTAGNGCATDTDCCSGSCNPTTKTCAAPSQISYCTQVGDICFKDGDCCTSICNIASGATAGTCGAIPGGTCSVDGLKCTGCTTTPPCCSSYCGAYGNTTATICQPAGGCRVLGDLCTKNSDCCGGDPLACTLEGAGDVVCNIFDTTRHLGTCSVPSGNNCPNPAVCTTAPGCSNSTCIPEGDVCHCQLFDSKGICWDSCPAGETCKPLPSGCSVNSVNANCCGVTGANKMTCRLDKVGVPRCYTVSACVAPGGFCASSADCCNGTPCVPDGNGHFVCGTTCVPQNGKCTSTGDCCSGLTCVVPTGGTTGTCTNPSPPPADMAGQPPADMAGQPPADLSACSFAGQQCSTTQPCCSNGGTCTNSSGQVCTAADTSCSCFIIP